HGHGHSRGIVDPAITRSRAGIRAVSVSLAVLTFTAVAQTLIYALTLSVALLADLIHNFGDASTAIPLGLAFVLRSARRTARRARSRARDLGQCLCRARPDDAAFHPPAHALPPLVARRCGPDRLRGQRDRGSDSDASGAAARQPGSDRRRQPRPR